MATITAIRQGLQVRLDTISGVHAYAYESDHPVAPAIMVSTYTADYDLALGGGTTYDFNLYVVLAGNVDRSYQEQIDSYLSPSETAHAQKILREIKRLMDVIRPGMTVPSCLMESPTARCSTRKGR